MAGTIRTLDSEMQKDVHERSADRDKDRREHGSHRRGHDRDKTPVTYNTPDLVKKMLPSLEKAAGKENVLEVEWVTGAEDFAFFREKAPAFYFFVGGMPKGADRLRPPPHHTPDFFIDDSRLDVGIKAFCNIVFDYTK